MRAVFRDVLPDDVLAREQKAIFHEVFWGPHFRAFAQAWRGGGVDASLVAESALRAEWSSEIPHAMSAMLLQTAWLASAPGGEGGHALGDAG